MANQDYSQVYVPVRFEKAFRASEFLHPRRDR